MSEPNSLESERSIIGAILNNGEVADTILQVIKPEYFYTPINAAIYESIVKILSSPGLALDFGVIENVSKTIKKPVEASYVSRIKKVYNPSANAIENHVKTVIQKYKLRKLISTCNSLVAEASESSLENPDTFLEKAEQQVYNLTRMDSKGSGPEVVASIVSRNVEEISRSLQSGKMMLGIPTGFGAYDDISSGIHPCELTILAGLAGGFKTAFATEIAKNVASKGHFVYIASLEMAKSQIVNRILCSAGLIDFSKIRNCAVSQIDIANVYKAAKVVSGLSIYIDDSSDVTMVNLRANVRQLQRVAALEGKSVKLVVVDYIQLMRLPNARGSSRAQELADLAVALKQLAKEFNTSVIALSQINRNYSKGDGPRSLGISDLKDSSGIEQAADLVVFIQDPIENTDQPENVKELIFAKHRNGACGAILLRIQKEFLKFTDMNPKNTDNGEMYDDWK